jgi:hypothetical protein
MIRNLNLFRLLSVIAFFALFNSVVFSLNEGDLVNGNLI